MISLQKRTQETAVNHPTCVDPHPNEFDLKRIERMLEHRVRYRYVSPVVQAIDEGYLVMSPCCSRNIDAGGGVIDIARIKYDYPKNEWRIYHKDHGLAVWVLHSTAKTLHELISHLNEDPSRVFWQ